MTDNTLRNTTDTDKSPTENSDSPILPVDGERSDLSRKSRRDAMAVLAKHVAYTTLAVLAILSLTARRARAFSF